ncbi:hypothetical protein ABPG72_018214 [Tetrahymena utriculariae]
MIMINKIKYNLKQIILGQHTMKVGYFILLARIQPIVAMKFLQDVLIQVDSDMIYAVDSSINQLQKIYQLQYLNLKLCTMILYLNQQAFFVKEDQSIRMQTQQMKVRYFRSSAQLQIFLKYPRKLTIVYDSQSKISSEEIRTLYKTETDFLQNRSEAQTLLQKISQMSQFILDSQDSVRELNISLSQIQNAFQYNRNGSDCIVSLNLITVIDKVPKLETIKKMNPSKKFLLKSVFVYIDLISKQKMTQYSQNLENSIENLNHIFIYCSSSLLILLVGFQLYYSIILGFHILYPVTHLTYILKQIKIVNQQDKKSNSYKKLFAQNVDSPYQASDIIKQQSYYDTSSGTFEGQIQINFDINSSLEGVCFSKDTQDLIFIFQNMFQILQSINKNYFSQDDSAKLLNLNKQIQHFDNVKNYSSLGICYNNIGVIHYNNHRYLESVKNFQKSIIYANYELNVYSHNNSKYDKSKNQQTENYKNKVNTYLEYLHFYQESKRAENQQEIQQLYQNLYNRKFNLLKALFAFLQQNPSMWDIFQEKAQELLYLSQQLQEQSNKREILTYYSMLKGFYNSNEFSSVRDILKKINDLYLNKFEKNQTQENENQENNQQQKTTDYDLKNNEQICDQLLISPIKKLNSKQTVTQNSQKAQNYSKKQTYDQSILFQEFINQEKQKENLQNSKLKKSYLEEQNNSLAQLENQKKNIIKSNDINLSGLKNCSLNIDEQIIRHKTSSLFKKKIDGNNNQKEENQLVLEKSRFESFQKLVKLYQNQHMEKKRNQSFSQPQNSEKFQINKGFKKEKQIYSTFYQLRKTLKNSKIQEYKFCSDIYFQYYAQSQADYQIYLNNQYNAANILTNCFEKCQYYLPHLKLQALNRIQSIFSQNKIKNDHFEEMKTSYEQLTHCNYHVYVISTCFKKKNQKKTYQICSDLYNDILHQQEDVFGLIQYQHQDQIFEQVISQILLKTLKSNIQLVDRVVKQLYRQTNQTQQCSSQISRDMPVIQNNIFQINQKYEKFQLKQQKTNPNNQQITQNLQFKLQLKITDNLNSSANRQNSYENSKIQENKVSYNIKKIQNISNKDFEIQSQSIQLPSYELNEGSLDIKHNIDKCSRMKIKNMFNFSKNNKSNQIISEQVYSSKQNYIKQYLQDIFKDKNSPHALFEDTQEIILEKQDNQQQEHQQMQQNKTNQVVGFQRNQNDPQNNNLNAKQQKCNKMKKNEPFSNNQTARSQIELSSLKDCIFSDFSYTCQLNQKNISIINNNNLSNINSKKMLNLYFIKEFMQLQSNLFQTQTIKSIIILS